MTQRFLRHHCWLFSLALAALAWTTLSAAQDAATSAVQRVAREWLALTDRGDGGATWDAAANQFKGAITRERWGEALAAVRKPFGPVDQRAVFSTRFDSSFSGAPHGEYAFVVFRTSFANRTDGQETVTLEREADGVWRVVGYAIR